MGHNVSFENMIHTIGKDAFLFFFVKSTTVLNSRIRGPLSILNDFNGPQEGKGKFVDYSPYRSYFRL